MAIVSNSGPILSFARARRFDLLCEHESFSTGKSMHPPDHYQEPASWLFSASPRGVAGM